MARPHQTWTNQYVEELLGHLLRGGVLLAAAVVLLGGVVYLFRHGAEPADYHVFHGEPADLRSVSGLVADAMTGRSRGVIQLGLLLLAATPIARVAFAAFAFVRQRDVLYIIVSLVVLGVLLYSLAGT